MAIAKKGSSLITVNTDEYRWLVSPDSGVMTLVVEFANDPGQRLEAQFIYDDQNGAQRTQITPKVVRDSILSALEGGWDPLQKGTKPFLKRERITG